MYSDEAESFAKFPAFAERFKAADLENFCCIVLYKAISHFQGAFFAPTSLCYA
jgi:hypothetical protein